jgi:hypothetical protein
LLQIRFNLLTRVEYSAAGSNNCEVSVAFGICSAVDDDGADGAVG